MTRIIIVDSEVVEISDEDYVARFGDSPSIMDPPVTPTKTWTPLQFMEEFTVEERIGMRGLAKTDDLAADWLDLLRASVEVRVSDDRTIAGMNYMVANGVLTQERMDAIIAS